jgi:hypothetical protein
MDATDEEEQGRNEAMELQFLLLHHRLRWKNSLSVLHERTSSVA